MVDKVFVDQPVLSLILFLPDGFTLGGKGNYTMFDLGAPELIIILVIIVLLFGPGRIAKTMGEVGKGIRSFKDSFAPTEERSDSTTDSSINPK